MSKHLKQIIIPLEDGKTETIDLMTPADFTPYVKKTDVVTETTNGLMSADDKQTVDSLPEYIVGHTDPSGSGGIFKVSNDSDQIWVVYRCTQIGGGPVSSSFSLNAATSSAAGVMSARDKKKVDNLPYYLMYDMTVVQDNSANIKIPYYRSSLNGEHQIIYRDITPATSSAAGAMSAADKQKLDSLVNYQAGNGIDITGNTISCTLDTSLYSIVTELPETGLPNKIYLLPSTKTEEGNIYTEYGYVDNKWEELGKYKADVNLEPYERALHLPSDVIKTLGVQSGANYVNVYSYKEDLDRGVLSEVSEFDIPKATSEKAGIITAQDKAKLDGIENSAQVNKIESVSVNGTPLEITNKGVNIPIHEYTAGDGIKLENGKFSLDTIEHTERSYTTKLIGPKEEPALNIPIVDESGKLNKNILIPNVADLFNRTPTEWTGEIDDLGCIRYEDYKNISDYYYDFTKNIFFYPIRDNQLLMYNIGKGIDDDKLGDFLKNPNSYDNWNIPAAIYLSDGLLFDGGLYGEVPVYDPKDDSKTYYPGGVFGFKVNIDKSENNLLTFTESEEYTDNFSGVIANTKKLIVPKQSVIDTIVNSNEFKAKQDALTEVQLNNINNTITSISINNIGQVNTNGAVNLTIPNATTSKEGLMSKEDKAKLDSIIDWSDNNAGLLPIYNGDGSDGEWIYTHWIGAGQGTDNTWRKASDIILENITSDAILNNTPIATTAKAGLMSADDKSKLANPISYYYRDLGVDTKLTDFSNNICYVGSPVLEILGNKVKFEGAKLCTLNGIPFIDCSVPKAIASLLDGLMSKEDKAKLDSQPTIKASDATGVTDNDYVVIKKSEYQSILDRLSALENKA